MTSRELAALLDKEATLPIPMRDGATLVVKVRIIDSRSAFGNEHVLVTPLDGSGQAWVSADRVKVKGGKS